MSTHFRPRQIDVRAQLQIITDPDLIEEIDNEIGLHSFTPIQSRKKRKAEEHEVEEINTIEDEKVPTPLFREVDDYEESHPKSKTTAKKSSKSEKYITYNEPTDKDLFKVVEYDLESEDEDFMVALQPKDSKKKKSAKELFTPDQLENLIDFFEKKSCQKQMPPEELELFQNYVNLNMAPCCVCGDSDKVEDNPLLWCDGCRISVHQYCYGILQTPNPEEAWLCRKCEAKEEKAPCLFCPITEGAFKKITDGRWGHVVCALWISELSFKNKDTMEPISQVNKIPKSKWDQQCSVCLLRQGVCVECSEPDCDEIFHVLCGRKMNYTLETKTTNKGLKFLAFCRKHTMTRELQKTPPTFGFRSLTTQQITILQNKLTESKRKLKLPNEVIELIYHFWQLKHKHNQQSLLRRFQYLERGRKYARNTITEDEYHARFRKLRQDFEKVRLLLDLIRKRESVKRDHVKAIEELIDKAVEVKKKLSKKEAEKLKKKQGKEEEEEIIEDEDLSEDEVEVLVPYKLQSVTPKVSPLKMKNVTTKSPTKNGTKNSKSSPLPKKSPKTKNKTSPINNNKTNKKRSIKSKESDDESDNDSSKENSEENSSSEDDKENKETSKKKSKLTVKKTMKGKPKKKKIKTKGSS